MPTSANLERARIRIEGDRLVVSGRFMPGDDSRYSSALLNFIAKKHAEYEVDLSALDAVTKSCLSSTVAFAKMANQEGRKIVVLASRLVAREFRLAGFADVGAIRVVSNTGSVTRPAARPAPPGAGSRPARGRVESSEQPTMRMARPPRVGSSAPRDGKRTGGTSVRLARPHDTATRRAALASRAERVQGLDPEGRLSFYERLSHELTLSIRAVWSDASLPDGEKVERIKCINEILHKVTAKTRVLRTDEREWPDADSFADFAHWIGWNPGISPLVEQAVEASLRFATGGGGTR